MFVETSRYEDDIFAFLSGFNNEYPHVLAVNVMDDISSKIYREGNKKVEKIKVGDRVYKLDSVVLRSTDKQHFSAFITINKNKYGFDGASYHRLNKFEWNKYLNEDKDFTFQKKDVKYSGSEFNFTKGYEILMYYLDTKK